MRAGVEAVTPRTSRNAPPRSLMSASPEGSSTSANGWFSPRNMTSTRMPCCSAVSNAYPSVESVTGVTPGAGCAAWTCDSEAERAHDSETVIFPWDVHSRLCRPSRQVRTVHHGRKAKQQYGVQHGRSEREEGLTRGARFAEQEDCAGSRREPPRIRARVTARRRLARDLHKLVDRLCSRAGAVTGASRKHWSTCATRSASRHRAPGWNHFSLAYPTP